MKYHIVRTILVDLNNTIWAGTDRGLFRFDSSKRFFTRILIEPQKTTSRKNENVFVLFDDNNGTMWVQSGHLFKYDRNADLFIPFGEPSGIGALYQDRKGMFWGGAAYGLLRMNILHSFADNQYKTDYFTTVHGLPHEQVTSILEDDHGFLWLGMDYGLSRFNPKTGKFKNFFKSDGLSGNVFNPIACFKNKEGEMFFGTTTGLTIFHPDSVRENTHIPSVVLTGFQKMNRETKLDTVISQARQLILPFDENILSFKFAALDYVNPAKNLYAYKMDGVDKDWVYTDANRRFASYTNLNPGEYVFRVKGSNNDDVWNEQGSSVKIIITPPPWKTWWAYSLYVISIVALLYGWRRYDLARQRLKHQLALEHNHAEKLAEIDSMKSRFFANISHEFRTPLTLILGPVEQMLSGEFKGNLQEGFRMIVRNGRRLLQLINELLDLSKLESGRLTLAARPVNIVRLLRSLVLSFSSLAERRRITLTFDAADESIIVFVDQDKLEKIILNLLSNAFKFTPARGRISVCVGLCTLQQHKTSNRDCVEIRIKDTGPGIPAEHLDCIFDRFHHQVDETHNQGRSSTGIGLALVKELVEHHHHGRIKVKSEVGVGSEFTVRLLLGQSHLKPEEIADDALAEADHDTTVDTSLFVAEEHVSPTAKPEYVAPDKNATIILVVEAHLDDENFTIANLGREVGMSRVQLHRKLRVLVDQSASQFVRSMRLQRAVELLQQKAGTIAEVAYMSGFHSQAYFTTCFHEQFGCSPKEYIKNNSETS